MRDEAKSDPLPGCDDPRDAEQLLPLVYRELRQLAAAKLGHERPGQTLQPTALVHEAYLRIVGGGQDVDWDNRRHFFAAAAEAMRRILVERARRRRTEKHGGELARVELDESLVVDQGPNFDILDLHEALNELAVADPRAAELVKLRYFAGLSGDEAAKTLDVSPRTADLWWAYARAWLFQRLNSPPRE